MVTQIERKEATRSAVLDSARALFATQGFSATSVEEVALLAKVAKGAVYHYFPSKEAIFEQVFRDVTEEAAQKVHEIASVETDKLNGIIRGASAYIRFYALGPMRRILLIDGPAVLGWKKWREIDEEYFCGMVTKSLERAMQEGLIATQPLVPLTALLVGGISEAAITCAQDVDQGSLPSEMGTPPDWQEYVSAVEHILEALRVKQR